MGADKLSDASCVLILRTEVRPLADTVRFILDNAQQVRCPFAVAPQLLELPLRLLGNFHVRDDDPVLELAYLLVQLVSSRARARQLGHT